jgi:hypothetical protein
MAGIEWRGEFGSFWKRDGGMRHEIREVEATAMSMNFAIEFAI